MKQILNGVELPVDVFKEGEWLKSSFSQLREPIENIQRYSYVEERGIEDIAKQMLSTSYDNSQGIMPANIKKNFVSLVGDCFVDKKSLFKSLKRRGYNCGEVLKDKRSKDIMQLYQNTIESCIRDGDHAIAAEFTQDIAVNKKYLEIYNEFFDSNIRLSKKPYIVDQWFLTNVVERPDTSSFWNEGHGNPALYIALYNTNTGEAMQTQFENFKKEFNAINSNKRYSEEKKKKERQFLAKHQQFEAQVKEAQIVYQTLAKTMKTCEGIDVSGLTEGQIASRIHKIILREAENDKERPAEGKRIVKRRTGKRSKTV